MSDLLLDRWGGPPSARPPCGALRAPGTVYLAFKPDCDVKRQAGSMQNDLCARHGLKGVVSLSVLHMTICPIGQFPMLPDERVETAQEIASRLVAKPFEMTLNRVRTYPNGTRKPPIVAFADSGVLSAERFRRALIADLRRSGFSFARRLPDPHMTLFYDHHIVAEEPIDPIRWVVRDFALVHSIYGEGRHELLGQWSLRD